MSTLHTEAPSPGSSSEPDGGQGRTLGSGVGGRDRERHGDREGSSGRQTDRQTGMGRRYNEGDLFSRRAPGPPSEASASGRRGSQGGSVTIWGLCQASTPIYLHGPEI